MAVLIFRKNWHQILKEHDILHDNNVRWNFLKNWDIMNSVIEKVPNKLPVWTLTG